MQKKSILIVDDDKNILSFLSIILEKKDYIVRTAETVKDAINICIGNFFDIVIIDYKLPDMSGTELLRKISDKSCVKIMLTGCPSQKNAIEAINLHADYFLTKPVKPNRLLDVIEESLERRRKKEIEIENKIMNLFKEYMLLRKNDQEWFSLDWFSEKLNVPS